MSIESNLQSSNFGGHVSRQLVHETEGMFLSRVQFIRDHWEEIGFQRALTRSMVFSNKHFLGCTYPRDIEEEVGQYPPPDCLQTGFDSMNKRRLLTSKRHTLEPIGSPPAVQGAVSHVFSLEFQKLCKHMSLSPWKEADLTNNPTGQLIHYAQQNGYTCIFHESASPISGTGVSIRVEIEGVTIAIDEGPTKTKAKKMAASSAIEAVFHCQKIFGHLSRAKRDSQFVSKLDLSRGPEGGADSGPQWDNRGLRLLQNAGWSGSPEELGSRGEGSSFSLNRAGLGSDSGQDLSGGLIEKRLHDFIESQEEELVFSIELSSDERKLVHVLAQRYGLRHSSKGQGESRYLVVSKRSGIQDPNSPLIPMPPSLMPEYQPPQYGVTSHHGAYVPPPDRYHSHRPRRGRGWGWNHRDRGRGYDRPYNRYEPY